MSGLVIQAAGKSFHFLLCVRAEHGTWSLPDDGNHSPEVSHSPDVNHSPEPHSWP